MTGFDPIERLEVLVRDGALVDDEDAVAAEVPIALEYNGVAHAVMFATPADLEDFARGFTLTEGIVAHAREIYDIEVIPDEAGVRVAIAIATPRFALLKERRRALTGRTGCGLCGTESLSHAVRELTPIESQAQVDAKAIARAMSALRGEQKLMQSTGAVHAAGWMDETGALVLVREDVGRHNALDKLLGAMIASALRREAGVALITSRASFEMVQKAVSLGIPALAAVSAPTGLAVRMARKNRLTLLGFVRDGHYACYSGSERLTLTAPAL